jgi:hypothetical protein
MNKAAPIKRNGLVFGKNNPNIPNQVMILLFFKKLENNYNYIVYLKCKLVGLRNIRNIRNIEKVP